MTYVNGKLGVAESIADILSDGLPHTKIELHEASGTMARRGVSDAVGELRKIMRPLGEDIICIFYKRQIGYQRVRLLASPNDGRQ